MEGLAKAFEVPRELASAMERVDSEQLRRSVELMGQCVQVSDRYFQGSIHPRIRSIADGLRLQGSAIVRS